MGVLNDAGIYLSSLVGIEEKGPFSILLYKAEMVGSMYHTEVTVVTKDYLETKWSKKIEVETALELALEASKCVIAVYDDLELKGWIK